MYSSTFGSPLKQSTAINLPVYIIDATTENGATGLADVDFTKRISKGSGAFGPIAGTLTEMENGWYLLPLSTGDTDTLGLLSITLLHGSGASKPCIAQFRVSARLPDDPVVASTVTGDVVGNLGGSVVGSVLGSLTGDVGGSVQGSVVGNLGGSVVGSVLGAVAGDVGGNVVGNVSGNVTGNVGGNVNGSVLGNVNGTVASVVGSVGSVTAAVDIDAPYSTQLLELWTLAGLDLATPLVVTLTTRDAGAGISQTLADVAGTVTVTRVP